MPTLNILRVLKAKERAQKKRYMNTLRSDQPDTACAYELGSLNELQKLIDLYQ